MDFLFFELIRVAIGTQDHLSRLPSEAEWEKLFDMALKQAIEGVCFSGLRRLGADADEGFARIGMSEDQYLNWMGEALQIKMGNEQMNKYTKEALAFFRSKGFACQVLKGQGIATLYRMNDNGSDDLRLLRQSGDIDIWLPGGRAKVYQLSREVLGKITGANYHHIHFPIWDDPEIEAHIYPSFLSSPYRNWQLQRFCKNYEPKSSGCDDIPSIAFNRIFILLHCYRHFSGHGVGMRQLMDYYFVLKQGFTEEERMDTMRWVKRLGMSKFAHATMWVLQEVFGLDDEYLLCEPDEKNGRFLLDEVMQTGNMGHSDDRVNRKQLNNPLGRYAYNIRRDLHVMSICPKESLWEPFFNLVLFLRRKLIWSVKYDLK